MRISQIAVGPCIGDSHFVYGLDPHGVLWRARATEYSLGPWESLGSLPEQEGRKNRSRPTQVEAAVPAMAEPQLPPCGCEPFDGTDQAWQHFEVSGRDLVCTVCGRIKRWDELRGTFIPIEEIASA